MYRHYIIRQASISFGLALIPASIIASELNAGAAVGRYWWIMGLLLAVCWPTVGMPTAAWIMGRVAPYEKYLLHNLLRSTPRLKLASYLWVAAASLLILVALAIVGPYVR
jgi:hypothetical protein